MTTRRLKHTVEARPALLKEFASMAAICGCELQHLAGEVGEGGWESWMMTRSLDHTCDQEDKFEKYFNGCPGLY